MPLTVRPLTAADRADWQRLWTAYLAFYETDLPDTVFDTTFARLLDLARPQHALLAEAQGKVVGLVDYLSHAHNWRVEDQCYLYHPG